MPRFALMLLLALSLASPGKTIQPAPSYIDHISLSVADVEVSEKFYLDFFGLLPLATPIEGSRWFDLGGGVELHLFPGRTTPVSEDKRVHLALAVPSFDYFLRLLAEEKIPFTDFAGNVDVIQTRGDGVRQIFVRDPDGYWIEVNDKRSRRSRSEKE